MKLAIEDPLRMAVDVRADFEAWLEEMAKDLPPGRFRFCKTRSFVPSDGNGGQATTCFAAKSAWHVGAWRDWSSERREGCIQFIKSLQATDGNFVDHWLLRNIAWTTRLRLARRGRLLKALNGIQDEKIRAVRAETRQSAATLLLLGDQPRHALPVSWKTENSVREFIRSLDWTRPWGAGSHASHLISFVVMNERLSQAPSPDSDLLEVAFEETDRYLDLRTGAWGIGDLGTVQTINGAMKMLTAYHWAERSIPHPERLIDYALSNTSGDDGCGVLDRLYVVHRASTDVPGIQKGRLGEPCLARPEGNKRLPAERRRVLLLSFASSKNLLWRLSKLGRKTERHARHCDVYLGFERCA